MHRPRTSLRRLPSQRPTDRPHPLVYRLLADDDPDVPFDPYVRDAALGRLEAALFLADEPLSARRLGVLTGIPEAAKIRSLIDRLRLVFDADGSSFQVQELAGGYQLLTRPAYSPWLARLGRTRGELGLSHPAMETLAIVAWKQPIARAGIEAIRGVNVSDILGSLLEKGLIRISGRQDSLGRPVLYSTTKKFLTTFGLADLAELPEIDSLRDPGASRPDDRNN